MGLAEHHLGLTFRRCSLKPLASVALLFALACVLTLSQTIACMWEAASQEDAAKLISVVKQTPSRDFYRYRCFGRMSLPNGPIFTIFQRR